MRPKRPEWSLDGGGLSGLEGVNNPVSVHHRPRRDRHQTSIAELGRGNNASAVNRDSGLDRRALCSRLCWTLSNCHSILTVVPGATPDQERLRGLLGVALMRASDRNRAVAVVAKPG